MPTITDWIMVLITAVYVIATIVICRANIKTADASRAQLDEMKRQYAEENRPIIELEFLYLQRTWYVVRFINHGKQTAQHVKIMLAQEFIDSLPEPEFRDMLEKQKAKECIIGVGQHYDLYIGSNDMRGNPKMVSLSGKISYEGRGATFTNDVFVDLKNYMTFFSSTSEDENLLNAIKKNTEELKGIKLTLQTLQKQEKGDLENS